MTPTETQLAFERTRARIESNLEKISRLSRSEVSPAAFFPQFLEWAADSLNATGAAFWTWENNAPRCVADWNGATSGAADHPSQARWIDAVVRRVFESSRPHIVAASEGQEVEIDGISNATPHPFFYHPVVAGDRPALVLQIWLPEAGDPRTYNDIMAFIARLCGEAVQFVRSRQSLNLTDQLRKAGIRLRYEAELVGQLEASRLYSLGANYAVDLVTSDIACLFRRCGDGWRLESASNQEVVDAKAVRSRALAGLAHCLPENTEGGQNCSMPELEAAGLTSVVWVHFSTCPEAGLDGLLLAGRHTGPAFSPDETRVLKETATSLAKALDSASQIQYLPLRPLNLAFARSLRAWSQNRRARFFIWGLLPCLLVGAVLAFPFPWRVSVDCFLVPKRKVSVVAETSGKIVSVPVRDGDHVLPGQVIAKLDDADQSTQLAVLRQQLLRARIEIAKAQSTGQEADRKIAEIQARREEEAIRRLEYLQSRSELRAPLAGTILTKGLRHREGEAIESGRVFCEIAADGGYDLQVDIPQDQLGVLLSELRNGRSLPLDFLLHAHPSTRLSASLAGETAVSQLPEARGTSTVFTARVPFPGNALPLDALKAGYSGKAKILLGTRPLAWIWFHPFLTRLRTWTL